MCAIAGILYWDGRPVDRAVIERMTEVMRHRGPDDHGLFVDGAIGLGHRRLSVIDLSAAGRQPMLGEDGGALVYNGEVYNFRELREALRGRGHRFRSQSDTEVVLRAIQEWGVAEALERFNGMFAFAYWDRRARRLWLVRDRYGIKPLYHTFVPGGIAFASEIKALLAVPGVRQHVCDEALCEYFTFQNVWSDLTLFDGIRILRPGHWLTVRASDGRVEQRQYWDCLPQPDERLAALDEERLAEQLRERFTEAVRRQLVSDAPLGGYLSGGLDSGSIVSVAARQLPRLMTFTGGFDLSSVSGLELTFDERDLAEETASASRTEHYEMVMHAGDLAWALPKVVWHLEDLRVGMCYQNYYIARLASRFAKVVLSGVGGDELFAGYPWRYAQALSAETPDEFDRRYAAYWQRLVPAERHREFFAPGLVARAGAVDPLEWVRSVVAPLDARPQLGSWQLGRALYFEAKTFLHGLLVVEDKVSMAHSLESRVPFLDNELVDWALRLPAEWKLRPTEAAGAAAAGGLRDGKYLFRQAMAGIVPGSVLRRQKQGFSAPDDSWYRGESMAYVKEILLDPMTLGRGYFQPSAIRQIVEEHTQGRVNHRLLIWSLLSFEWWNRLFMDVPPIAERGRTVEEPVAAAAGKGNGA